MRPRTRPSLWNLELVDCTCLRQFGCKLLSDRCRARRQRVTWYYAYPRRHLFLMMMWIKDEDKDLLIIGVTFQAAPADRRASLGRFRPVREDHDTSSIFRFLGALFSHDFLAAFFRQSTTTSAECPAKEASFLSWITRCCPSRIETQL